MVGLTDFFRTVGPILLELCVGDLSVASGKGYTFVRLQRPGEFQSPASSWGSGEPSQPVHPGPDIHHGGPSTFETVGYGHGAKGGCSGKGVADRGRIVAGDMTEAAGVWDTFNVRVRAFGLHRRHGHGGVSLRSD